MIHTRKEREEIHVGPDPAAATNLSKEPNGLVLLVSDLVGLARCRFYDVPCYLGDLQTVVVEHKLVVSVVLLWCIFLYRIRRMKEWEPVATFSDLVS